ncbi:MAG: sugar MFS transporter [Cytophagaceae bacterium]|nr:sugar MFS transporter [Cytophagaceae bacterium]
MDLKEHNNQLPSSTYIQAIFSVLFFMWGLLTVLNFVLLDHLKYLFQLSYSISTLINLTFFGAYLIVSLYAGSIIKKVGYKKGIFAGWVLSSLGCFVYVLAVSLRDYHLFLAGLFIQASGITILQVGANLYVVLFGNSATGASRINFVQGFNSLGTVLPPYLIVEVLWLMVDLPSDSRQYIMREQVVEMEAQFVYYPYLVLGVLMTAFAVFLWYANIPQINIEKEEPLNKMPYHPRRHVMHFPQLRLGAFAIFAYVGAEVAIANYLEDFAEDNGKFYWGAAMVGRFIGAFVLTKISPRIAVGFAGSMAAFLVILSIFTSNLGGIPIWTITAVGLFNSILFPSIFALGINGLGKFSLDGSSVLIMSIVGGAVIPFVVRNFSQMKDFPPELSQQLAFIIPVICYLYIVLYGLKFSRFEKKDDIPATKLPNYIVP